MCDYQHICFGECEIMQIGCQNKNLKIRCLASQFTHARNNLFDPERTFYSLYNKFLLLHEIFGTINTQTHGFFGFPWHFFQIMANWDWNCATQFVLPLICNNIHWFNYSIASENRRWNSQSFIFESKEIEE